MPNGTDRTDTPALLRAGIGKSTLLGLIQGTLEATAGHITRNATVRMAAFSQHHMDGLELHLSPLQYFARVFESDNVKEEKLRAHLGRFGIAGELAMQPMYTLSGGQKSRVAFAKARFQLRVAVAACPRAPAPVLLPEGAGSRLGLLRCEQASEPALFKSASCVAAK